MIIGLHFLLDDGMSASGWGDSLKMVISILVMCLVGIAAFIWWARRG
jgi:hypothetical protein